MTTETEVTSDTDATTGAVTGATTGAITDAITGATERRNEATMRRIYAELFDEGLLDRVDELMAPDVRNHTAPPGHRDGTGPVRELVAMLRTAFPDCRTVVEEVLARGDTVVMRNLFEGTHLGVFLGHPPTGRRFRFRQVHWMRFGPDGRVVEHWGVRDDVTHLRQLGLMPEEHRGGAAHISAIVDSC
ncbi:MAG: ester cyclase [Pseudonocardia sp.]